MDREEFENTPDWHMKRLVDYLQHLRVKDGYLDRLLSRVLKEAHAYDKISREGPPESESL